MNKEQLAQIVLKNYIELAQAMDPGIKDNDEELLACFEVLQQQVLSEMNRLSDKKVEIENNQEESSIVLNTKIEEPTTPVYEQDEYSEEIITELAQQLIETGTLITLTPISEELMNKIAERAKQLQQPKQPRPRLFQNSVEKIKNSGLVKKISLAERNLLSFFAKRIKIQDHQEEIDDIDDAKQEETKFESETISPVAASPMTIPLEVNHKPENQETRPLSEAEERYIEQAARLYLKEGYLATLGHQPPVFAKEILQRAQEIKQQEGLNNELNEMLTEESVETETRVSTK